jgi:hypothetical protein
MSNMSIPLPELGLLAPRIVIRLQIGIHWAQRTSFAAAAKYEKMGTSQPDWKLAGWVGGCGFGKLWNRTERSGVAVTM